MASSSWQSTTPAGTSSIQPQTRTWTFHGGTKFPNWEEFSCVGVIFCMTPKRLHWNFANDNKSPSWEMTKSSTIWLNICFSGLGQSNVLIWITKRSLESDQYHHDSWNLQSDLNYSWCELCAWLCCRYFGLNLEISFDKIIKVFTLILIWCDSVCHESTSFPLWIYLNDYTLTCWKWLKRNLHIELCVYVLTWESSLCGGYLRYFIFSFIEQWLFRAHFNEFSFLVLQVN